MHQNTKLALGLGTVAAIGAYFIFRPKTALDVGSVKKAGPSDPGSVQMDVTGTSIYQDPTPGAFIDPVTRTLADSTAASLMQALSGYYMVSIQNVDEKTTLLGCSLLPAGTVPENNNNMVPVGVPALQRLGYTILITADVGQAVLTGDQGKITKSIAVAATKDPKAVQDVLHKAGYVWLQGAVIA